MNTHTATRRNHTMSTFDACMMIEEGTGTENEIIDAWQLLIDTGLCWQLQGFYGRGARSMIAQGLCVEAR